jgi:formylglycine-generating enzyme required for sulfatase activity
MVRKAVRLWPVGQKKPNDSGLFDMLGNVCDWCHDFGAEYPKGSVEDREDPRAVSFGLPGRVVRGASCTFPPTDMRCSWRQVDAPAIESVHHGMRVARTCQ